MKTPIIAIARASVWNESNKAGQYTQSTVTSTLEDVGFIHCTTPDQTMDVANRHFKDYEDLVLLVIDPDQVKPQVKFEKALSGREGLFPHIYGPLNTSAITQVLDLKKDSAGNFVMPSSLTY